MSSTASRRPFGSETFDHPRELAGLLPADLRVGIRTSAFSIEGALQSGGRGPSVWDDFAKGWGRIRDESSPLVSADHLARIEEDVDLLRDLGVQDYAFSMSWTRIQPDGRGAAKPAGLAVYDRLLDALLGAGIRPRATLCHWDPPAALAGGWLNRDTALRFGDYAEILASAFGDRVAAWTTLADPATVTIEGYALGRHAPGRTGYFGALPAAMHQLLASGLAVQAIRSADVPAPIGIELSHTPVVPASDRDEDTSVADLVDVVSNRLFADAVLLGRLPTAPEGAELLLGGLATAEPEDLRIMAEPVDELVLRLRPPLRIAAGAPAVRPDGTRSALPLHAEPWPEFPLTGTGEPDAPEFIAIAAAEVAERYPDAPPVTISGVGAGLVDRPDPKTGEILDVARVRGIGDRLAEVARLAAGPGPLEIRGVLIDTLLDGFEWTDGYTRPRGLVAVDPRTRDRSPKLSYGWLRDVLDARS